MSDGISNAGLIIDDREDGIFRVHRSSFIDREIFELERARVFDRSWLFAGHVSELPNPGDFVTRSVAGRPLILAHGDDDRVRILDEYLPPSRQPGLPRAQGHRGRNVPLLLPWLGVQHPR